MLESDLQNKPEKLMAESLFDVIVQVGKVLEAEPFEEARKPGLVKLKIDLGDQTVGSAAQLRLNYAPEELEGRQVLCATNLGTVSIAGFQSEVLILGVPDAEGYPVLVVPERPVPLGGQLY